MSTDKFPTVFYESLRSALREETNGDLAIVVSPCPLPKSESKSEIREILQAMQKPDAHLILHVKLCELLVVGGCCEKNMVGINGVSSFDNVLGFSIPSKKETAHFEKESNRSRLPDDGRYKIDVRLQG